METTQILILLAAIVIGYFLLKFIWNNAIGLIKFVLALIVIVGGIYLVKPELLYNVFGENKVESTVDDIKKETIELVDEGKGIANEIISESTDSLKKEAKKIGDNVTN